jgi:hypothetical protein
MFRAAYRSSSGAPNCICSLWLIYTCGDRLLSMLGGNCPKNSCSNLGTGKRHSQNLLVSSGALSTSVFLGVFLPAVTLLWLITHNPFVWSHNRRASPLSAPLSDVLPISDPRGCDFPKCHSTKKRLHQMLQSGCTCVSPVAVSLQYAVRELSHCIVSCAVFCVSSACPLLYSTTGNTRTLFIVRIDFAQINISAALQSVITQSYSKY